MSVSEPPLFSMVIVSLNAQEFLTGALDSVLYQSCDSMELVIVDGGSTDGTLEIIHGYQDRFGDVMRWSSEPDKGLYDAMNKGLNAAGGKYVVYLGSDDRLEPEATNVVTEAVRGHDAPEIIAGATRVFGGGQAWVEAPRSSASRKLPKRAPSRHQSLFVSRQAMLAVGGFDTRYCIAADYDLYLRLLESGARELLIDKVLSEFRLGGVSSSNAVRTAREYRDVRIAHGSNAILQQIVALKSIAAATIVGSVRGVHRARRTKA